MKEGFVKAAVGHTTQPCFAVRKKNSLSSVSPFFILRLLLLRQPHHPPPVLLLQLLDQLLLSPDLLPLPSEVLVLPGVKSHLALDVLVDVLGRACSLNNSKYVLIWILAAHNLFNMHGKSKHTRVDVRVETS